MNRKQKTFSTFLRYLIPNMIGMVMVAVYTFTDTFVVGKELGSVALGAMGVCTPVLTVMYALGFLFGMGGGSLYSISKGQGDQKGARGIYTTAFVMLLGTGIVLAVVGNIFADPIVRFLGAGDDNIAFAEPYFRSIITFAAGFMFDVFIMTFMKNAGHPTVAMIATFSGTGLNIILDCVFVFVFKWGMFGAAFATCIGSGVCSAINLFYIFYRKLDLIPSFRGIRGSFAFRIFKTGLSVFILESSSGIVTFVFIQQANRFYGTDGSAIYTMIMNWTLVCFNLMMGIAQSVQPLLSTSYGENDHRRVRIFRTYSMVSSLIAGVLFLVIGYAFTEPLLAVFASDNPELVAQTVSCFRWYLPAYFLMSIGISIGIYFQSLGYAVKSLVVMLARGIVLPIAFAFLLPVFLDTTGLWIAVAASELVASAIAVFFLLLEGRKRKGIVM